MCKTSCVPDRAAAARLITITSNPYIQQPAAKTNKEKSLQYSLVTEKRNVQVTEVVGRQGGGAPTVRKIDFSKRRRKKGVQLSRMSSVQASRTPSSSKCESWLGCRPRVRLEGVNAKRSTVCHREPRPMRITGQHSHATSVSKTPDRPLIGPASRRAQPVRVAGRLFHLHISTSILHKMVLWSVAGILETHNWI